MRFSDSRILSGTNSEYSSWGDMDPNASPLSPEKPGRRVARVEKLIEYIKSINTTEGEKMKAVNDLINRATPSTALEVLQWINSLLLDPNAVKKSPRNGRGFGLTWAGNKHSIVPEPELQDQLFEEYLRAIQSIDDRKKRALLSNYAINNLHFFSDGNGRTARAVYFLIMDDSLMDSGSLLVHDEVTRNGYRHASFDSEKIRREFLIGADVISVETIDEVANILLQESLINEGVLNDKTRNLKISFVSGTQYVARPELPKEVFEELSDEEKDKLDNAFSDGFKSDSCSTLAGLTLAAILSSKHTLERNMQNLEVNNDELEFKISYDETDGLQDRELVKRVRELFSDWTHEDCTKFIEIHRSLKQRQNEIVMSIFTDNLCFLDDWSISDWAIGKYSTHEIPNPDAQKNVMLAQFMKSNYGF